MSLASKHSTENPQTKRLSQLWLRPHTTTLVVALWFVVQTAQMTERVKSLKTAEHIWCGFKQHCWVHSSSSDPELAGQEAGLEQQYGNLIQLLQGIPFSSLR